MEELQTIGLGKYKQTYKYTENKLRKEHKFQQRLSHMSNEYIIFNYSIYYNFGRGVYVPFTKI